MPKTRKMNNIKKNEENSMQNKQNSNLVEVLVEESRLIPPTITVENLQEMNLMEMPKVEVTPEAVLSNDKADAKIVNKGEEFISINSDENIDEMVIDENETVMTSSGLKQRYIDITRRKKPALRAKHRRIRQNRRLRKILTPKNAAMALHELNRNFACDYITHGDGCSLFVAEVTVDGVKYRGSGISKTAAKNNASENALRNIALNKILNKPLKDDCLESKKCDNPLQKELQENVTEEQNSQSENNDNNLKDSQMDDCSVCSSSTTNVNDDVDDVPMLHIASFALYKLFKEWENKGQEIQTLQASASAALLNDTLPESQSQPQPQPVPQPVPPIISVPQTPTTNNINMMLNSILNDAPKMDVSFTPKTELPPKADEFHPTILLSMLRPGITYTDLGSQGKSPQIMHTVGVTVDGTQFIGSARSKKLARRYVAREACNTIFGTKIPQDESLL